MVNDKDTLPPEAQAVIDAARKALKVGVGWYDMIDDALRAYDASRRNKDRYTAHPGVSNGINDIRENFLIVVPFEDRDRILGLLNCADRGEFITREECERRERAADRKAREECIETVGASMIPANAESDLRSIIARLRASIKP